MSSSGFGICGHKNTYSSSVKNGKWVEDLIGLDLATHGPPPKNTYVTEHSEMLIAPKDMVNNSGNSEVLSLTQIKGKNGLPAATLFEHLGAPRAGDRFMSVNAMTYTNGIGSGGLRVETLLQEKLTPTAASVLNVEPRRVKMVNKSKEGGRREGVGRSGRTESQFAGRNQEVVEFRVRAEEGEVFIPSFSRKKISI